MVVSAIHQHSDQWGCFINCWECVSGFPVLSKLKLSWLVLLLCIWYQSNFFFHPLGVPSLQSAGSKLEKSSADGQPRVSTAPLTPLCSQKTALPLAVKLEHPVVYASTFTSPVRPSQQSVSWSCELIAWSQVCKDIPYVNASCYDLVECLFCLTQIWTFSFVFVILVMLVGQLKARRLQ